MDEIDQRIIRELQLGIPIDSRPYEFLARKLGISEEELLNNIRRLMETGVIRKFGAVLHHRCAGYYANAMVVWRVPPSLVEEAGIIMASFQEVTHCYQRPTLPDWPYNLFTMIHGHSQKYCKTVIEKIAVAARIHEYRILYSISEFKKTSTAYYVNNG